ncbi:14414_t:CDS:2, partial [Funneliformis geosporum]
MGTPTFSLLYEKLCDAVILADRATQEAIFCYCQFGKAFIQRRGEIASEKQVDPESNTVSRILNIEVKTQLPAGTSDALLRKRIEQAKKLYTLFNAIDNIPFDYSIHMETQLCEPNSQSDKKNSDLSHITSSDASTESQIPNESALKKFDTK